MDLSNITEKSSETHVEARRIGGDFSTRRLVWSL